MKARRVSEELRHLSSLTRRASDKIHVQPVNGYDHPILGFHEQPMPILQSILRVAQCRSVNHLLVLDTLHHFETAPAQRLSRILLKHHDATMEGASAPDRRFRDFPNHVVQFTNDGPKGAPQKCVEWFDLAREHLDEGRWKQAAYACGVLSHYFTNSILPFHVCDSLEEPIANHPLEWTLYQAYSEIAQHRLLYQCTAKFEFSHEDDWLSNAVTAAASMANPHVEDLWRRYLANLPSRGLPRTFDAESLDTLVELVSLAVGGVSGVLSRLADETTSELPQVSLTSTTLLAAIDMPLAWLVGGVARVIKKKQTQAVARRLSDHSGGIGFQPVSHNMVPQNTASPETASILYSAFQVENPSSPVHENHGAAESAVVEMESSKKEWDETGRMPIPHEAGRIPMPRDEEPVLLSFADSRKESKPMMPKVRKPTMIAQNLAQGSALQTEPSAHFNSPLVNAPSIGPKTAKRFEKIGVRTIGQFLRSEAEELETALDVRWISAPLISDWQDQARLVCEIPVLCGYEAQLLVAMGCRTGWQLRTSEASRLAKQIASFCETSEGQQILRSNKPPVYQHIVSWIDAAQSHARQPHSGRRAA